MYNIAIIEDDKNYSELMKQYVGNFSRSKNIETDIDAFYSGTEFLASCSEKKYDIVFMDIILPEYDGLEISRRFRKINEEAVIIFVTNMAQYAINGYEVNALDFLVKPVTYINFCLKITKAIKAASSKAVSTIALKSLDDGVKLIKINRISFVESFGHHIVYHIVTDKIKKVVVEITVRDVLNAVEKKLASPKMFRCNKSYIVNLDYVVKVKEGIAFVENGTELKEIPLSRISYSEFMKRLAVVYKS